jgi:hypothetical protein
MEFDANFMKNIEALGDLTSRKKSLRMRIYIAVGIVVFPAAIGLWAVLGLRPRALKFAILGGAAICFAISESIAKQKLPALAEQVARDHDIPLEVMLADAQHVESGY